MRIKWSPTKVIEAADILDRYVAEVARPLEEAKSVAQAAKGNLNLPQYVQWQFTLFISRANSITDSLQYAVDGIRRVVPADALAEEKKELAAAASRQELLPDKKGGEVDAKGKRNKQAQKVSNAEE